MSQSPETTKIAASILAADFSCLADAVREAEQGGADAIHIDMPILPFVDRLHLLIVLAVNPGFGGQAFDPRTWPKLQKARRWRDGRGLNLGIGVDGGVNEETIGQADSCQSITITERKPRSSAEYLMASMKSTSANERVMMGPKSIRLPASNRNASAM